MCIVLVKPEEGMAALHWQGSKFQMCTASWQLLVPLYRYNGRRGCVHNMAWLQALGKLKMHCYIISNRRRYHTK